MQQKRTYRIPPCPSYDMAGLESWLEAKAKAGWFLIDKKAVFGFFAFDRMEPLDIRYRLEPISKYNQLPEPERLELYHSFGWEYGGEFGKFHLYRCFDPDAPDLNTDPQVQAMSLDYLKRSQHHRMLLFGLLVLAIGIMVFPCFWMRLVLFGNVFLLSYLLLLGGTAVYLVRSWFYTRKMIHKLSSGKPIPRQISSVWLCWTRRIIALLLLAVMIPSWCYYLMVSQLNFGTSPLAGHDQSLPFPTCADLVAANPNISYSWISNADLKFWSDPLAPVNYQCTDGGSVIYSGGTEAAGLLEISYHEVISPWLAEKVAKDYTSYYSSAYEREAVPLTALGLDYTAAYYNDYGMDAVVLQHGHVVVYASFIESDPSGDFSTERWAQLMAERLMQASD